MGADTPPGSRPAAATRIGVLASGGGSNLGALLAHFEQPGPAATGRVVCVASDREAAGALDRARARGIAAEVIPDPGDGRALVALLEAHEVSLVVLAGYLRLVPPEVVARWSRRMLNVHPALLPAFGGAGMYGMRVHAAVVASGARLSGATVHFVDEEFDRGAILAQWPVPVFPTDAPDEVAARVLAVEHRLLPAAVEAVCAGVAWLGDDGRAHGVVALPASRLPHTFSLASAPH
jgi:formyltetrahydrofolate-dependent phosphoribosylglycinamide formyltransferase